MEIPEILQNKKVLLAIGGVAVVLYIWKPWQAKTTTSGPIDYGTGVATGSADQSAAVASQVNSMQNSIMGQVGEMLSTYQTRNDASTQALSQGFTTALQQMQTQNETTNSKIADQMATISQGFQTQLQNQSQYFSQSINRVATTAAAPTVSGTSPTIPTIQVAAGSPEARYLNDEYGGKIHIIVGTANQFVGIERPQTNQLYENWLGNFGIAPQNRLTDAQLWTYK